MSATGKIAKFLMKRREVFPPSPSDQSSGSSGLFWHPAFQGGSEEDRAAMMLKSSEHKYHEELEYPWDEYFGTDLTPFLRGKTCLDLGCFSGGRGIAWFERYGLERLAGVDVHPLFIEAASRFAAHKGVSAEYALGRGEELPFPDASFDAVLSFDVFEHVQDPQKALEECRRVLKPDGMLFVVFPGFYHPTEHHLSNVTRTPFFHYFFSSRALLEAYSEIIEERGEDAAWYRRESPEPEPWERSNSINGTTHAAFRRLLKRGGWTTVLRGRRPVGSVGRNASRVGYARTISRMIQPLAFVPGLDEIVLHRVTWIVAKSE